MLATDRIRAICWGQVNDRLALPTPLRQELRDRVYDELLWEAGRPSHERQSVVLDGTFLTKILREEPTHYVIDTRKMLAP